MRSQPTTRRFLIAVAAFVLATSCAAAPYALDAIGKAFVLASVAVRDSARPIRTCGEDAQPLTDASVE
jgi:hypothetical protein